MSKGNNLLGKALKLAIHATPKEIEEATIKANLNDINGMIQQIANFTSEYGTTLTIQELQHKPFVLKSYNSPAVRDVNISRNANLPQPLFVLEFEALRTKKRY